MTASLSVCQRSYTGNFDETKVCTPLRVTLRGVAAISHTEKPCRSAVAWTAACGVSRSLCLQRLLKGTVLLNTRFVQQVAEIKLLNALLFKMNDPLVWYLI